ncbi:hypothetical protein [Hyphococcus sp.]|uniref:hypothetical protein n=1 Tax=Hyphococcus sp. TaxID=2038636 RepID=UPI003CCBF192
MQEPGKKRTSMALIAHAILWAGAMLGLPAIFKDQAWAENMFLWLVAGFIFSNGLLLSMLGHNRRC